MKQFIELAELEDLNVTKESAVDPWEKKAECYYRSLLSYYQDNSALKEGIRELSELYYQELAGHLSTSSSKRYHTFVLLIRLFRHTCVNDYISTLPVCNQVLESCKQEKSDNPSLTLVCLHFKMIAFIQLGEFRNGLRMVKQTERLIEKNSWNWFKTREYLFLLGMRTGRYHYAARVLKQATEEEDKKVFREDMIRHWALYQTYVALLCRVKKVPVDEIFAPSAAAGLNFSDEELSMGLLPLDWVIPNFIVHILIGLSEQKYDEVESLLRKADRYVVNGRLRVDHKRSYYFFKLLLLLPEAHYSRRSLLPRSIPFLWRMVTIRASGQGVNRYPDPRLEIIPYEALWRLLLTLLN